MARFLVSTTLLGGIFLGYLLFTTGVSAQTRQQEENACGRDATRLCKPVLNDGDMAVLACLRMHRDKLRPACIRLLQEKGQLN